MDFMLKNKGTCSLNCQHRRNMEIKRNRTEGGVQEKASLINVNDSFKKIIIVKDVIKPWHDDDRILTMIIYDFLLNEHSLDI